MTRRFFIVGAAALLSLPLICGAVMAAGKPDIPIEKMTVKVSHVPSLVYAGLYVAVEHGYFAQRGLDIQLVIVRGGDTAFQTAGGTIQFAGGSPDSAFFNSLDRKLPLEGIASLAMTGDTVSTTPLMVRKDLFDAGTVTRVEQLRGRKVANLAPGGITEYLLAKSLAAGGLTLKDVQVLQPMGFPQMVDALTTKAVDAARLAEPFATMALRKGVATVIENKSDLGEQILWIQTNSEFAKQHPAVVVNYLIGYLQGAREVTEKTFRDPEIERVIEKYTKVPPDITAAAVPPVVPPDGVLNVKSIMAQQAFHLARGSLTYQTVIPPERFLDDSYRKQAVEFLGPFQGR